MSLATTDGQIYDDARLGILLGDGMMKEDRAAALGLLRDALAGGCSSDFLWRLAGAAVWDGVGVARALLAAPQQPAQPAVAAFAVYHRERKSP